MSVYVRECVHHRGEVGGGGCVALIETCWRGILGMQNEDRLA